MAAHLRRDELKRNELGEAVGAGVEYAGLHLRQIAIAAAARMVEKLGGVVTGFGFIIELTFLPGREKLAGYEVESLIRY